MIIHTNPNLQNTDKEERKMNLKSWFHKAKTSKKAKVHEVSPKYDCILTITDVCALKDVPANKFVVIDKMCRNTYNNDLERFIFKIDEAGSHKIDDIQWVGSIFTRHATYISGDERREVEVIHHVTYNEVNLTLRELRDNCFPSLSLSSITFCKAYQLNNNNVNIRTEDPSAYTLYYYHPLNSVNMTASEVEEFRNTFCNND